MRTVTEIQERSRAAKESMRQLMAKKRSSKRAVGQALLEVLILDWTLGWDAEHLQDQCKCESPKPKRLTVVK